MRIRFCICFILFLFCPILSYCGGVRILLLDFENLGQSRFNYINGVVKSNVISFFKAVPGYITIDPVEYHKYLEQKNVIDAELDNPKRVIEIAHDLDAELILGGNYQDEGDFITINFSVIDVSLQKVVYRFGKSIKKGITIIESLDSIARVMVEDFTGLRLALGECVVETDVPCDVFIDNERVGISPYKKLIPTGKYALLLKFTDDSGATYIVYNDYMIIEKEKSASLQLNVYYTCSIKAEKRSVVKIQGKNPMYTPCETSLITGQEYDVSIIYYEDDGKNRVLIDERQLLSSDGRNIELYFPITGVIAFDRGDASLKPALYKRFSQKELLHFTRLDPGDYRLKFYITNEKQDRRFWFKNSIVTVKPGAKLAVTTSELFFKPLYGLTLLPGASQFYNMEYPKASTLLSLFLGGITLAALSPAIFQLSYYFGYLSKIEVIQGQAASLKPGTDLGDLSNAYRTSNILFYSFLVGGITIGVVTWVVSLIDGIYTMYKKQQLFRNFQEQQRSVKISFDIRFF